MHRLDFNDRLDAALATLFVAIVVAMPFYRVV